MRKTVVTYSFLLVFLCFYSANTIQAQGAVKRVRIGLRMLVPNISGLHGEFVLPVANNRLSISADYTYLPLTSVAEAALSFEGRIDASFSYLAIGPNFYLGKNDIARGAYLGLSYHQFSAKTRADTPDYSGEGKASFDALGFRFGTTTGRGTFTFGFEIGAAYPFGNITGTIVNEDNGRFEMETFDEPFPLPVLPILNLTLGIAL